MSRIFISYRRDDSAADMTDRLYERLHERWGRRVFMDLDSLVGGDLFEKTIEENLRTCGVMLVVIGRYWASLTNEEGQRRIDNPRDYPRMEVAAALRRGVRVIPVLVGDAPLPKREELPPDIVGLIDRQYVRVSRERFAADVQHLIDSVASEMPGRSWRQLPWRSIASVLLLLAAAATAYFTMFADETSREVPSAADSSSMKAGHPASAAKETEAGKAPGPAALTGPGDPPKAAIKEEGAPTTATSDGAPVKRDAVASIEPVNVSGRWGTAAVAAAYGNPRFTLQFEFTQLDDAVVGTVTETSEGSSRGFSRAIFDGKIKNNVISFHTKGEVTGGPNNTFVPYKEFYVGMLQKDRRKIAFRRYNDVPSGGAVEAFVAVR